MYTIAAPTAARTTATIRTTATTMAVVLMRARRAPFWMLVSALILLSPRVRTESEKSLRGDLVRHVRPDLSPEQLLEVEVGNRFRLLLRLLFLHRVVQTAKGSSPFATETPLSTGDSRRPT